jgi:hypothetical protein
MNADCPFEATADDRKSASPHREPDMYWTDELRGCELRNAVVTCDRS